MQEQYNFITLACISLLTPRCFSPSAAAFSTKSFSPTARSAKRLMHAGAIMWNRLPPAAKCSNRYLDFKSQALQYIISDIGFPMLTGLISVRCNQPSVIFSFLFFSCIFFSTISFNMLFTVGPMLLGILPVLISTINKVYNNNNPSSGKTVMSFRVNGYKHGKCAGCNA